MARVGASAHWSSHMGWRSVASAILIVGILGSAAQGGTKVHAATAHNNPLPTCAFGSSGPDAVQPGTIQTAFGSSSPGNRDNTRAAVFTSGTLSVLVGGATVTFSANNSTGAAPDVSQDKPFDLVQSTGCSYTTGDSATVNPQGSLNDEADGACTFVNLTLRVGQDGKTNLFVLLSCSGGKVTVDATGVGSVDGQGTADTTAATPELSPTELVATGFIVTPLLYALRRRRQRRSDT